MLRVAGAAGEDLVADRQHGGGRVGHGRLVLLAAAMQCPAMLFASPLVRGTLLRRYKRFLADVMLEDGREVTAHCANPGAMLGLNAPGHAVWLEPADGAAAQARLRLAAGRARRRAFRRHRREPAEPAGRRGAGRGRHPGARRLRARAAGGALRHAQPGRLPAVRAGRPDAYVEVKNVHFRRDGELGGVPGQRDRARGEAPRRARGDGGGRAPGGDALRRAAHRLHRPAGWRPTSTRPMRRLSPAARAAGVEVIAHASRIDPTGSGSTGRCRSDG